MMWKSVVSLAFLLPILSLSPVTAQTTPKVDPEATAAMDRMGAFLRTLKQFEIEVEGTTEEVFSNGQKLQFRTRVEYSVITPDKMFVDVRTDRKWRRFYYDGSQFTIAAPADGYYAQFPATGRIRDLLQTAYNKYGIDFPLQDLFLWGEDDIDIPDPTEAMVVGYAQLGDYATTQYAFRQPGIDYQVWIDMGDEPLPRKIVIIDTEDAAQPEYVANFEWDLDPQLKAADLAFKPDSRLKRIALTPDDGQDSTD